LAYRETPSPDTEIIVTGASGKRETGYKKKSVGNGVNHAVGNIHAVAFRRYVKPNLIKIDFDISGNTMRHQRVSTS